MIPLKLTLKNFLSYREASLDFQGLHTACICGPNGSGKSSLLEGITWALWGKSRSQLEDDIIHAGAKDVRVDFTFKCDQQIYRVIRTRNRGGTSSLEFQYGQDETNFKPLTQKGIKATQSLILHHIKLDYETFINSAYLRQGKADEFMLKRPAERKQVLADLLKLDRYEELSERAKEKSKEYKIQSDNLKKIIEENESQLELLDLVISEYLVVQTNLNQLQNQNQVGHQRLTELQSLKHQHNTRSQQLIWTQTQEQNLSGDLTRIKREINQIREKINQLQILLDQESRLTTEYETFLSLQKTEEQLSHNFTLHSGAVQTRQDLQQQQIMAINQLERKLQQIKGKLENQKQQEQDLNLILTREAEIEAGLKELEKARHAQKIYDEAQNLVSPLIKQLEQLKREYHEEETKLKVNLEQLYNTSRSLQEEQEQKSHLQQAVLDIVTKIDDLENKKNYQQRVEDKGRERNNFMKNLQSKQCEYEQQIGELGEKLKMLETPNATCPLCDRPLDELHWNLVIEKTQNQKRELEQNFWIIREQLTVCEREIKVLRQEYRQLQKELEPYDHLKEERSNLTIQIGITSDAQQKLIQMSQKVSEIEQKLSSRDYAREILIQINQLEVEIQAINYDERSHALARQQVESLRWAEIRKAEIKQAINLKKQIQIQLPSYLAEIASLEEQIKQQQENSELIKQIQKIDQTIADIGYNIDYHHQIKNQLRQIQSAQLNYTLLQNAKAEYPQLNNKLQELTTLFELRSQDLTQMKLVLTTIQQELENTPDYTAEIKKIEQSLNEQKKQINELIGKQGRLKQQQEDLEALSEQLKNYKIQLEQSKKQYKIYDELAKAFGKNGIQAYMIENVLPELEAKSNSILSRLSGNQLHVQFLTQKTGSSKKSSKLIDTLDILISDTKGTRSYETYSGGEAFRINFAIRLALAHILAQRAGTALQLLIVDEGFGTQDQEGCDRLVAAINAISTDFACILTVTHIPSLKEAFQTRIEIQKTAYGSKINLSI